MDRQRLQLYNPWWQPGYSIQQDQHLQAIKNKPYEFTPTFLKEMHMHEGDIFVIRGPRQVGKTTALKIIIADLIAKNTDKNSIFYLSCESLDNFKILEKLLIDFLNKIKGRSYIFLDEISFVDAWQRAVLSVANLGLTKQCTLVITGSNARDLKQSAEKLPGRRGRGYDVRFYPLSLLDYAMLPCFKDKPFDELLNIYSLVGGFPMAIADFVNHGIVLDQTYEIYRNWIIGDAQRYGLRQETLKHILYRIAQTLTSQITWTKLIENSPVKSHETALEYIEHLQDAFLCYVNYCYDEKIRGPALQKARKIYFVDPLLYYLATSWKEGSTNIYAAAQKKMASKNFLGDLFESIVVNHAMRLHSHVYYWYSSKLKKEIDLVLFKNNTISLLEIKLKKMPSFRALNEEVHIITPENFKIFIAQIETFLPYITIR